MDSQQCNGEAWEVIGWVIYVYDEKLKEAVKTLKHEYLDFILTQEIIKLIGGRGAIGENFK